MIAAAAYEEMRSVSSGPPSRGWTLVQEEGMASWLSVQLSLLPGPSVPVASGLGPRMGGAAGSSQVPRLPGAREGLILALARMTVHNVLGARP
jgi:hypothetical protein